MPELFNALLKHAVDVSINMMFNTSMSDKELIQQLGGASALARTLGYQLPDGARRVHNWTKRGIPSHVKVERPDLFMQNRATPSANRLPSAIESNASEAA